MKENIGMDKKFRVTIQTKEIMYKEAIFEDYADSEEEFNTFITDELEEIMTEIKFKTIDIDFQDVEVGDIEEIDRIESKKKPRGK